jgi:hypothetical protein
MHDGYKSWLILSSILTVGCGEGAVDLGGRDASGWADAPTQDADPTQPQTLFEGEAEVVGLAVDETTLYALLYHVWQGESELVSCPIDRCRSERSTLSFSPESWDHTPLVLVADRLYWIANLSGPEHGVASCPLAGCETPDLVLSPTHSDIAGDGEHVYWIDSDGWLNRLGPGSAEPEKVRELLTVLLNERKAGDGFAFVPSTLEIAGDHVYFVNNSVNTDIYRVRKDGSEAPTRVATDESIGGIGVTTEALYYTTSTLTGAILSCPLAGCEDQSRPIATNQRWPSGLRTNHGEAFWFKAVQPGERYTRGSLSSCRLPECSTVKELAGNFVLPDTKLFSSNNDRAWVAINRAFVLWVEAIEGGNFRSALRRSAR